MRAFRAGTTKHGKALFAARAIAAGEHILNFTGPLITYKQVEKKRKWDNPLQIGPNKYIDPRAPALYLNHSCEPNVGITQNVRVIALRPIRKGEELCFDYSTTMDAETMVSFECSCGAHRCRTELVGFPLLPKRLQAYYVRNNVVQPFLLSRYR